VSRHDPSKSPEQENKEEEERDAVFIELHDIKMHSHHEAFQMK